MLVKGGRRKKVSSVGFITRWAAWRKEAALISCFVSPKGTRIQIRPLLHYLCTLKAAHSVGVTSPERWLVFQSIEEPDFDNDTENLS
jgi:hypothetical protein